MPRIYRMELPRKSRKSCRKKNQGEWYPGTYCLIKAKIMNRHPEQSEGSGGGDALFDERLFAPLLRNFLF
jgi:hypothetical protein